MSFFKKIVFGTLCFSSLVAAPFASADKYDDYMKRILGDMKDMGMSVDAFNTNPFQTGTSLEGYYLSDKTLLLERDAFFAMKANKLRSTEAVAEFQFRTKTLRSHANNILLQLMQAVDQRNKEGFYAVEKPAQEKTLADVLKSCEKPAAPVTPSQDGEPLPPPAPAILDAACVADRVAHPETNMTNILVDNFGLASEIFKQIPHMHVLEVNAVYQLVQLLYLEVLYSQNALSAVEFDLFMDKQHALNKVLDKSRNLTTAERDLQKSLVTNVVRKWKARILERKFRKGDEFKNLADGLKKKNQELVAELDSLRKENPGLLNALDRDEKCLSLKHWREHRWCNARKDLRAQYAMVRSGTDLFAQLEDKDLPKDFWKEF